MTKTRNRTNIFACGCRFPPTLLLAGALILPSTVTYSQETIGRATAVVPQAQGTHEGNTETLAGGSNVYSQETIHTGESGVADLRFRDDSKLSVGSKAEILLDKFVYDPDKSSGTVAVEAARGSFRFVTGSQKKGVTYQIKTPFGTLGVRG